MSKFSFIQRLRNKIKIKGNLNLNISTSAKIVNCSIYNKGDNNTLIIDDKSVLRNIKIEIIGNNCKISIGKNCMLGDNCYLVVKENTKLIIKDNCGLSRNIKLLTSDGHPIFQDNKRINNAQDIIINENVWIADNVTILKGVNIGSGSVVGINSTLTKSINSNVVAAGNPASVIKTNISWKDKF